MKSKTERLNLLFEKWMSAHSQESEESIKKTISGDNITKDFFEIDGIINEEAFEKEKTKVLFITAEANVDDHDAKAGIKISDYRQHYTEYYDTGKDGWRGKMRERISGMYKYLTHQNDEKLNEMADKFAVMDINKRGGKATIDKGKHLVEYAKLYKKFLIEEIEIINPDIIVLVGINLYRLKVIHELGCIEKDDKCFFNINGKIIPILLSFQTGNIQFQAKRYKPLLECDNTAIGILCAKLKEEIGKYTND